jgi:hypothetical protein
MHRITPSGNTVNPKGLSHGQDAHVARSSTASRRKEVSLLRQVLTRRHDNACAAGTSNCGPVTERSIETPSIPVPDVTAIQESFESAELMSDLENIAVKLADLFSPEKPIFIYTISGISKSFKVEFEQKIGGLRRTSSTMKLDDAQLPPSAKYTARRIDFTPEFIDTNNSAIVILRYEKTTATNPNSLDALVSYEVECCTIKEAMDRSSHADSTTARKKVLITKEGAELLETTRADRQHD